MSLILYYHPLSSFCHKVLIAFDDTGVEFDGRIVNLGDAESSAELRSRWPLAKFPLLRDPQRDLDLPESSIIIEYLDRFAPESRRMLPTDPDQALEARLWDRFFDLHVQQPLQKIVGDRIRKPEDSDPKGVADARAALVVAYGIAERRMQGREWAAGERFGMADCAAAPALFYASILVPIADEQRALSGYFERLVARPSVVRVIEQAQPYFKYFPFLEAMPARFRGTAP